ncbi:uncharacterized protein LOC124947378 isoform X5 [Vespa velutina]|uniref:uncharacterized protein LOC124947378 isoform X5 n=1 Tax=Vespa velutina TaxID=202808 RepID=UPI001FB284E6|nr:uncharacterized protein LOC124947378 isoform X5 [Vespa velutina]
MLTEEASTDCCYSTLSRPLLIFFLFLFFTEICAATYLNSSNTFLERCRLDCSLQRDFASCGKYKVARWLNELVKEKEFTYGPFRIIRISSMQQESLLPKLPRPRAFKRNIFDTLDFLRENVNDLLTKRVVVYTIENPTNGRSFTSGPMIMDEDELQEIQGRKEAEGSLIAPSILAHLKVCKVPTHPVYSYHTWATAAEAPVDYPTGYGHEDTGWAHRNDIQGHLAYPAYHGYRNPYG